MIFLFEQFPYSTDYLKEVLPTDKDGHLKGLPNGLVSDNKLDGVGYLFNAMPRRETTLKEDVTDKIVFVLPKVFLENTEEINENGETQRATKAFGQPIPQDERFSINAPKDFLSQLSLWVCSSIAQYRCENPTDSEMKAPDAYRFGSRENCPTLIDVMNAMKTFYAENRNLFVFTAKNKHSGNNRIDWRRTVSRTQPFIQDDAPIYMDLENKKKIFDLDDRLLVLYFSAMNYVEETFGFKMPRSEFYAPMRGSEFRRLLGHRGLMELRRIKHKYFADRFLKLYNIMKAFFEWGGTFSANGFESEYLLTNKYNNVFEAMIDKLVGDELPRKLNDLKDQKDGKIVDHLYKDRQLIFADEEQKIWFVGDSKYYKDSNGVGDHSVQKQFTYAKNIIQYNINSLFDRSDNGERLRYRDELTEGYSVTPSFFIRGQIPKYNDSSQFQEPYFRKAPNSGHDNLIEQAGSLENLWEQRNRHFANRLFDRDTLLLQEYNVNFLYVLKAYTSKRSALREEFKKDARRKFRRNFLELLDKKYDFWALWPKANVKKFVASHFRTLVGKFFQPEGFKCLILALENNESARDENVCNMNAELWRDIERDCKMIARITPKELWEENTDNLPEANFGPVQYDKKLNGFFVERKSFEQAKIGDKTKLPVSLREKPLDGSVVAFEDKDKYYFLPCKAT